MTTESVLISGRTYEADVLSALVFADGRNVIGFRYMSGSGTVAASQFRATVTHGSKSLQVVAVADTAGNCDIDVTHLLRTLAADPEDDPFPDYSEEDMGCGEITVSFAFSWRLDGQSSWTAVRLREGGSFTYSVTVRRGLIDKGVSLFRLGESRRRYMYYPFTMDLPNYSGAILSRSATHSALTLPYYSGVPLYSTYRLNVNRYVPSTQDNIDHWSIRPAWNATVDDVSDNVTLTMDFVTDLTPLDLTHYVYLRYLDRGGFLRYLLLRKRSVKRNAKFTELYRGESLSVVPNVETSVVCGVAVQNQSEYDAAVDIVNSPWVDRLLSYSILSGAARWERCAIKGATFSDDVLGVDSRDVSHQIELTVNFNAAEGVRL